MSLSFIPRPGDVVYASAFPEWGRGVVVSVKSERYGTAVGVYVAFDSHPAGPDPVRVPRSELRKTPHGSKTRSPGGWGYVVTGDRTHRSPG
jgi:hypothetical protein